MEKGGVGVNDEGGATGGVKWEDGGRRSGECGRKPPLEGTFEARTGKPSIVTLTSISLFGIAASKPTILLLKTLIFSPKTFFFF